MNRLRKILTWSALALLAAVPALADGAGTLKFDEKSFEVSEEAGVASITIERSQREDGAVSVRVATPDPGAPRRSGPNAKWDARNRN